MNIFRIPEYKLRLPFKQCWEIINSLKDNGKYFTIKVFNPYIISDDILKSIQTKDRFVDIKFYPRYGKYVLLSYSPAISIVIDKIPVNIVSTSISDIYSYVWYSPEEQANYFDRTEEEEKIKDEKDADEEWKYADRHDKGMIRALHEAKLDPEGTAKTPFGHIVKISNPPIKLLNKLGSRAGRIIRPKFN